MEFTNGEPFDNSEPEFLVHYEDDPYPPSMTGNFQFHEKNDILTKKSRKIYYILENDVIFQKSMIMKITMNFYRDMVQCFHHIHLTKF